MSFQDTHHELADISASVESSDFEDRLRSNVKEIYENVVSLEELARRLSQRIISQRIVSSVSSLLRRTTALIAETTGVFKRWATSVMSDGGQSALKREFAFEKLVGHFRLQVTRFQKVEEVIDKVLTQHRKEQSALNAGGTDDIDGDVVMLSSPDTDHNADNTSSILHQQRHNQLHSPHTIHSDRRKETASVRTPKYTGHSTAYTSPNTSLKEKSDMRSEPIGSSDSRSSDVGHERELVRVAVPSPLSNTSETKSLRRFIDHSDSDDDTTKKSAKIEDSRNTWNDVTDDIRGNGAPGFSLLDGNYGDSSPQGTGGAGGFAEGGIDAAATALDVKINEQGRHRNRNRRKRRGGHEGTRETDKQHMRMRRTNNRQDSSEGSNLEDSENDDWRNNSTEPRDAHGLTGRNRGRKDVPALSEDRHDVNADEQALLLTVHEATESPLARQIANDRSRGVKRIAQQVSQANSIFRELANLVVNQDVPLQTIDDNMKSSLHQARGTVKEVDKAAKYQAQARRRCLFIVVILGVAAFTFFYVLSMPSSPTIRSRHFSHRKT